MLSIVSGAYIKIVLKQRRSQKAANVAGAEQQDSAASALTLKVTLMIGSQLAAWIPFILTTMYFQYITRRAAPPIVFEVFALVVIPMNSFLNPVFYSEMYKKVKDAVWGNWRQFVSFVRPTGAAGPVATSLEEHQGAAGPVATSPEDHQVQRVQ